MQALAELDEDENPDDDDAIEIPSKDKYKGWMGNLSWTTWTTLQAIHRL